MERPRLFHGITEWLLDRALRETELAETVRILGRKLVDGGLPVCRINVGGLLLHPLLGGLDLTWELAIDSCRTQLIPRSAVRSPRFKNAPFYHMVTNKTPFERYRLTDPAEVRRFPLFETLAEGGVTDYVALFESYGRSLPQEWADLPAGAEGAIVSFATRRINGFSDQDIANLTSLAAPFALAVKTATDQLLAKALLEIYLGKISGGNVLAGLVEKGDGRILECALWYSDLRGSTKLAAELDIDAYFSTINDYFDCTAGAVLDHGGEVLKFIGDGVMAIFPIEEETRPASDMCTAAVMTAREALSRGEIKNKTRSDQGLAPFKFGIGLHTGKVMYGNVGTERRLDLTVTGPAVNEVARLESLCKRVGLPVVASQTFESACPADFLPLGRHDVEGIEHGLEVFTLAEFTTTLSNTAAE